MVQINGTAQHTKGKELESFKSGGDFLSPGEYTVVVTDVETDKVSEKNYITIVFENNEGKEFRHNQFIPPFDKEWQEKQYVELLARLGIDLDTQSGNLSFNTDKLKNKSCNIVLKRKWNDNDEKFYTRLSYNKVWNKGDEVKNEPTPMTQEERALINGGNSQGSSQQPEQNPFENADGPVDVDSEDLPF